MKMEKFNLATITTYILLNPAFHLYAISYLLKHEQTHYTFRYVCFEQTQIFYEYLIIHP